MKNLIIYTLTIITVCTSFQCSIDDNVKVNSTIIHNNEDGFSIEQQGSATIYEDHSIRIEGEKVKLLIEDDALGQYHLSNNTYSQATYQSNASFVSVIHKANIGNESNGFVELTEIDLENKTVSGNYEFTGYYSEHEIEITKGSFSKLELKTDPRQSSKGKVAYNINGIEKKIWEMKFLNISSFHKTFVGYHADTDSIFIQFPDNIYSQPDLSSHPIVGNEFVVDTENEEISFCYYNGKEEKYYCNPTANCRFIIQEHIGPRLILHVIVLGNFESDDGTSIQIDQSDFFLNWN